MSPDPVLAASLALLTDTLGCHTVVLYGSRARGDATEASDYDLAGFRADGPGLRIAHQDFGGHLDAFVYPEAIAENGGEELLKLRGGKVLAQRDGAGDRLLERLDGIYDAGPPPWANDERAACRAWADKMLLRIARGDIEGDYRRVMLLYQLLEDYFRARDLWYEGPKASFTWLAAHAPETRDAFRTALKPGADLAAIQTLVRLVWQDI